MSINKKLEKDGQKTTKIEGSALDFYIIERTGVGGIVVFEILAAEVFHEVAFDADSDGCRYAFLLSTGYLVFFPATGTIRGNIPCRRKPRPGRRFVCGSLFAESTLRYNRL